MRIKMKNKDIPHLNKHTQTVYFDNGTQRVVRNVTHTESGQWVHIFTNDDGHGSNELVVNPDRVLFIRIVNEN